MRGPVSSRFCGRFRCCGSTSTKEQTKASGVFVVYGSEERWQFCRRPATTSICQRGIRLPRAEPRRRWTRIFGKQRDFFVLWPSGDADLSEFMRWLTRCGQRGWNRQTPGVCRAFGIGPMGTRRGCWTLAPCRLVRQEAKVLPLPPARRRHRSARPAPLAPCRLARQEAEVLPLLRRVAAAAPLGQRRRPPAALCGRKPRLSRYGRTLRISYSPNVPA